VRAATRIMDAEGPDAVTTRRIATELGVRPMALYTYFRSKDEILVAIYENLVTQISVPPPEGGIKAIREVMLSYFRLAAAHPALFRAATSHDVNAVHELRLTEAVYTILLARGVDRRRAVGVRATLMRFTIGAAVLYPQRQAWDRDATHWPRVAESMRTLPASDFPVLRSFGEDLPEFTQEQAFEYGLDLILGGIQT
jgi:TetR/AcrR family tetracycline transcriptional repressor